MWVALIVTRSRGVWRVYLCWDQGVVERCPDDAVSGYAQSGPGRLVEEKKKVDRRERKGEEEEVVSEYTTWLVCLLGESNKWS